MKFNKEQIKKYLESCKMRCKEEDREQEELEIVEIKF